MSLESINQIIQSLALVISVIISAVTTWKMLDENRKKRLQKIEPHIIAYLRIVETHDVLGLTFKNIGEGCAKNVVVKVLKDYYLFKDKTRPLSNETMIKNGLAIMLSQDECTFFLGPLTGEEKIDIEADDSIVELEIKCHDIMGKEYIGTYKLLFSQIDLRYYLNPPETYMGQIPYYLKEIKNELKGIKQR